MTCWTSTARQQFKAISKNNIFTDAALFCRARLCALAGRKFALFKRLTAPIGFEKGRILAKIVTYVAPLNRHAALLFACLGALLVYGQTVQFHFVNWDDPPHVYQNAALLDPAAAAWQDSVFSRNLGYAMPVTLLSWRLDRALYGPQPPTQAEPQMGSGYHTTQLLLILLYVYAAYAFFALVPLTPWAASWAAFLCVLHPIAVEPLAWITGRKDLLCGIFVFLALAQLHHALQQNRPLKRLLLFGLFSVLAMGSKPIGVLCAPLGLFALWTWPRPHAAWPLRRAVLVVFGVGLVALLTVAVDMQWHRALGGLSDADGVPSTLRNALYALGFQTRDWLWPLTLRPKYVVTPPLGFTPLDALALVPLLALPVLALHPRTRTRPVGFAAALAIVAYLPAAGLVGLRRYIADTYLFLPHAAAALALASLGSALLDKLPQKSRMFVAFLPLLLLLPLALPQVSIWRDSVALWAHTQRLEPDSPQVCRMLGHGYGEEKQPFVAVEMYEACAQRFGPSLFANNLAVTAFNVGDRDRAKRWFSWILQQDPHNARARRYMDALKGP